MNRTLRALFPLAMLACATPSLMADVTMRLTGKVTSKDGKPVAGAKIALKKLDTGWHRDLVTDADGVYSQAGLQPDKDKNFEVTITKDGFSTRVKRIAVPLQGSSLTVDFTIYRPGETPLDADAADFSVAATAAVPTAPAVDPALKEDSEARAAFNAAIPLYNDKKYAEALPGLASAYKGITDAVATMKDEEAKAESQALVPTVAMAYGLALHQLGKDDDAIEPLSRVV
ncbi:MAG TPA: carboxypeptidase-like regulatory domain-containing protein, partial [Holophagaceae bacterium]|nr:carboxypeptidase-like regulatory domain-containing protein [Holophagaceae bacterium]